MRSRTKLSKEAKKLWFGGVPVFRKKSLRCAAILAPPAFGLRRQRKSVLVPFPPGPSRKSINFNKKIYIDSFFKDASIETPEKCMLYGEFLRNGTFFGYGVEICVLSWVPI